MSSSSNRRSFLLLIWITSRPSHWIKNIVVFAVPLFGFVLDFQTLLHTGLAFLLFCMTASGVYIINDVLDRDVDRKNPMKQDRPIASGELSVVSAISVAVILFIISLSAGFWYDLVLGGILLGYIVLQQLYSVWFKHLPIIDLLVIALGFVLRVLSGTITSGTYASSWLLLAVGLLALFLGIEKRKSELTLLPTGKSRFVLKHYTKNLLDQMKPVVTSSALVVYILWALEGPRSDWMLLTVPFVIYGIFRYQYLAGQYEKGQDPIKLFISSPSLVLSVVFWALTGLLILYVTT